MVIPLDNQPYDTCLEQKEEFQMSEKTLNVFLFLFFYMHLKRTRSFEEKKKSICKLYFAVILWLFFSIASLNWGCETAFGQGRPVGTTGNMNQHTYTHTIVKRSLARWCVMGRCMRVHTALARSLSSSLYFTSMHLH